jgi:gas vesicle protein
MHLSSGGKRCVRTIDKEKIMKAFLVGLGLGVGLGVLFAPMSGEKTRNTLQERAQGLASSARETYKQGLDRVQRKVSSIRSGATLPTGTEGGA